MKKLTLDVELLEVESFDTSRGTNSSRGTVQGRDSVTGPQEPDTIAASCGCTPPGTQATCGQATCGWTCAGGCTNVTCGEYTCGQTCPNTCFICGPQDPG